MRFDKIFIIIIVAAFFVVLGRQLVVDVISTLVLLTRLVASQLIATISVILAQAKAFQLVIVSQSTGNDVRLG